MYTNNASLTDSLLQLATSIKENLPFMLSLLGVLWGVFILNQLLGKRLCIFGILPRKAIGIPGIALHPFLHANFGHLFFNSIPIFVLGSLILIMGQQTFICVTLGVTLMSGTAIWLLGRPGIHLGASTVIMGYWSFLLINAYQHPTITTVIIGIISLYYFAGLFLALFPAEGNVSWEGHVFGFLAGIAANYLCLWNG